MALETEVEHTTAAATWQVWCDASHHQELHRSAWAAVIMDDQWEVTDYANMLPYCSSSLHAELWAVVKSLQKVPDHVAVTVFSDCRPVVDGIKALLKTSSLKAAILEENTPNIPKFMIK
jgi:ribonuclease HI